MRLCVNGHWFSDVCRCLDFWQGDSCDSRDCGDFGTRNDTNHGHGYCYCDEGYAGEFCEYEVCRHRNQWYCNSTRSSAGGSLFLQERHLCSPDVIENWLPFSANTTPSLNCDCGYGHLTSSETSNTTCVCQSGYYGEFCQWSSCPKGELWDADNKTCIALASSGLNSTRTLHPGFFGYDINIEFDVSAAVCLALILIFALIGRIILRRFWKRGTQGRSLTQQSTVAAFYDQFDHFLPASDRDPDARAHKRSKATPSFCDSWSDAASISSLPTDPYLTTASAGPVLVTSPIVVVSYRQDQECRRPRSKSMSVPLETVYEGVPITAQPRRDRRDEHDVGEVERREKF